MSDAYWEGAFTGAEREVHEVESRPNPLDRLAARIKQLIEYRDEVATGVWHDTKEYPPPTEKWLLTWWEDEDWLKVAQVIESQDGEKYWADWDGDRIEAMSGAPSRWARINAPRGG